MLHKHQPIAEEEMHRISPAYSICQVLREIYFSTEDPQIKVRCRLATTMAKAMSAKLVQYKGENWFDGYWDENPFFDEQRKGI